MKRAIGESPLDDLDVLVAEVDEGGLTFGKHGAVTVLHGSEGGPDAFSHPHETDQVQGSALAGVGAHDALVSLDA